MQTVDILLENGTILTMDPENKMLGEGWLGINGDAIVAIGGPEDTKPSAGQAIDARGGVIMPGLINGHTHAAMSLFRGLADDLPLMEWLNHYIFPVESRMDGAFVFTGTLLACAEMIMSGTTTFCDMYLFEDSVAGAAKTAGMRAIVGEVLYDFDSPNYGSVDQGLTYTEELITKWKGDILVSVAVEPHSPFTCSPDLLSATNDLAQKYDVPLIIHLAETAHEIQEVKQRYGRRPVAHLESLGLLGPHLIADHCVHLQQDEIQLLAARGVKAIHNPESNMKLASGIAPIPEMLANGIAVGLGTDGCASNNNLDLFAEMDMAAKLHKVSTMDTTVMDALTVLRMATIQGAVALGIDTVTGSLEVGKKADVIIVDMAKPHLTPMYNPYSHLVYAARGNDVSHVVINGRVVMEERRLLAIDLGAVLEQARARSEDVKKWLKQAS
jgi:5-methylthioadenosine/S-adenosylhomocysteine deaminase